VDVSSVHARLRQRETVRDKKRSYSRAKTAQKKAFVFVSVSHHGKGGPKAKSSQFKVVANTIFLDFVRKDPVMPMKKLKEELMKKKKGPKINSRNTQLLIGD
jgi:hypothetical protein